ncbi:hypothetical protein ES703_83547 [subsurface metagenome]
MSVTGIEVRRRNPDVAAMGVVVGEKVELTYGDTLKVNVSFDYRGLAGKAILYGAIGNRKWAYPFPDIRWFDEILHGQVSIDLPESPEKFTPCQRNVDIPITSGISPGTDYDLYVKLSEYLEAGLPEVDGVIDIVGAPPEYELIQHTIYPWAYTFQGDAEVCTFEFKLTGGEWIEEWLGEKIVNNFVNKLEEEGSRLLELKVSKDTTPLFWTNYRVEVTATASPLAWNPIIIGVLAVLFVVAIVFAIKAVESLIYHRKGLDEETKKTFSRDTLLAMILDLAPETPSETLGGMGDQELRDLLNQLLAEVAPPISPWAILALVGGLGVLGVGAAVALAAKRG